MILDFHTPKGIFTINTDTITDKELKSFNMTREKLNETLDEMKDPEIEDLKQRIEALEQQSRIS